MKFKITNRWPGTVIFECELSTEYEHVGYDLKLGEAIKIACQRDVDLNDANLFGADLRDADLHWAPSIPNIHQAVYEAASQPGALEMGQWHVCETTHCRAGWVITLAGEAGGALEARMGPPAAAALIYLKSDPALERIPQFYARNADALEDMKRLADAEAQRPPRA